MCPSGMSRLSLVWSRPPVRRRRRARRLGHPGAPHRCSTLGTLERFRSRTSVAGIQARGPLAHRVEQGTFNPKVQGSRPWRPTSSESTRERRRRSRQRGTSPTSCRTPSARPAVHRRRGLLRRRDLPRHSGRLHAPGLCSRNLPSTALPVAGGTMAARPCGEQGLRKGRKSY
jgi:hypothetical protein